MVEIPTGLVEAQIRYNGDAGREFIAVLPARAAEFLERWGLTRTGPGMHGVTALVLPVERADGTPAALKLQALDEESAGSTSRCGRGAGTAAYGSWTTTRRRARCCWSGWTRAGTCRCSRPGTYGRRYG